ncbi:MAG: AI-2E family transporter [Ignavibacteriales bacterium]|nr:MAG: AI-2E family transporter [Ignavibacteriales bacterium]
METEISSKKNYYKLITYLLGFICFVIFVYILMALQDILIPVIIAIFLTYLFHPLMKYLKKFKIPYWLSLIFILIIISGLYYLLGLMLFSTYQTFSDKIEFYAENLSTLFQSILSPFNLTVREVALWLDIPSQDFDVNTIVRKMFDAGMIQTIFNSFSSLLGDFFISLVFWVFMIMGKDKFEERLKFAFTENKEVVEKTLVSINTQLQSYIIIKTIISLSTGIIFTIILMSFGVDFAVMWGVLAFVLNYIPNIGSLVATIFPILISIIQFGFGFQTITMSALLIITQNILGNFVEPNFLGRKMDLSPVFVLFSLIFWGWIWGIAGMFLAVPIAALMKIFANNINSLKPLAVLMGNRAE